MTFSDKKVAETVNTHFVSAWINRGPGFHNEDYSTEQWIFTSAMEAYTTKNICTFFLTPDGKVFHYVAGYYSPDVFLTYVQVVLQLRGAAFDEKMALKPDGAERLRFGHGEVLKAIQRTEESIRSTLGVQARDTDDMLEEGKGRRMRPVPAGGKGDAWKKIMADYETYSYRTVKHQHSAQCAHNLFEGYRYLTLLHKHWSEAKALPALKDVQFTYLWGNPFTEEAPGAKQILGTAGAEVMRGCRCD